MQILRRASPALAVAFAFVVGACADQPTGPASNVPAPQEHYFVTFAPDMPEAEYIAICKVGPPGTYTFHATITSPWGDPGNPRTLPTREAFGKGDPILFGDTDLDGNADYQITVQPTDVISWGGNTYQGACLEDAAGTHSDVAEGGGPDVVVEISEVNLPSGTQFVKTDVYSSVGSPPPFGTPVITAAPNQGNPVSVTTSGQDGANVIFYNELTPPNVCATEAAVPSLSGMTDWLFIFSNGSVDANWQGATKGFYGDVAVADIANTRTSGGVPYAGTIYTDGSSLGAWQNIVNQNAGQAFASLNAGAIVNPLFAALDQAFVDINALAVNAPAVFSGTPQSLNGLNVQNGTAETFVLNVTSGFQISTKINITGDADDVFILRWDSDANFANGYQGQVKIQSGGAIVPLGGLTPASFVHVAGNIGASGGGSNPPLPYPQGPGIPNGANWNGGGFFTGYWLTTGAPGTFQTSSLSNAIFVGGWYSTTTKFSMTSGTSGVHVVCVP